jgi:hypothetical protein
MPRLRIAAPHGPRGIRLSGGRSRRLLTHDEGAVPTDVEYVAWGKRFTDRSKRQLQGLVSQQRAVLRKKAEELKLPFATAAEHIAAAFELAKRESAAKAEGRVRQAAGVAQREREREREKEREREQKVRPVSGAPLCRASSPPPCRLPGWRSASGSGRRSGRGSRRCAPSLVRRFAARAVRRLCRLQPGLPRKRRKSGRRRAPSLVRRFAARAVRRLAGCSVDCRG